MNDRLKAPFPWFGGKSMAAKLVWSRFGDCKNYVEPFAGSLAVLLARPHWPFCGAVRVETVNDRDAYVANAWRAIAADPDAVAVHADNPVNECDLHARHAWLHRQAEHVERLKCDPEYYDARIAGYWVWGLSSWIGDNFCRPRPQGSVPHLGDPGMGVNRQLPHLGDPGKGVNRQLPHLGNPGKGVNRQLPGCADGDGATPVGGCEDRRARLLAYMRSLSDRLRGVRVCCGDWTRVCTPSVTHRHGVTGVLLDPPYDVAGTDYGESSRGLSGRVREWALEAGKNPLMRVALCGYADEDHGANLPGWECVAWRAGGGYNNIGDGANRRRERIWFSPACLPAAAEQGELEL